MISRSPEAGPGPGNDRVDVADQLDDNHQQQGDQDVAAVKVVDFGRLGVHLHEPLKDQETQHQGQEKQAHQDLA